MTDMPERIWAGTHVDGGTGWMTEPGNGTATEYIRADLAAEAGQPAPVGVAVKPLVWTEFADIDVTPYEGASGDNLAVALCSYFDRHLNCPDGDEDGAELDEYESWKVWVSENAERVLRRIATKANDLMDARIRSALVEAPPAPVALVERLVAALEAAGSELPFQAADVLMEQIDAALTAARAWREGQPDVADDRCVIWSNQHRAYWRDNSAGYTVHAAAAGIYSRAEALSICRGVRNGFDANRAPDEVPVRLADLNALRALSEVK